SRAPNPPGRDPRSEIGILDDYRNRRLRLDHDLGMPPVPAVSSSSAGRYRTGSMKLASLHLFEDTEARGAAENMALDEALFLQATFPVMRSYAWIRPSVSFGYFTPWRSVIERFAERDAVRRWTGGGIVEHGNDFTYSVIFPGENSATSAELYRF